MRGKRLRVSDGLSTRDHPRAQSPGHSGGLRMIEDGADYGPDCNAIWPRGQEKYTGVGL